MRKFEVRNVENGANVSDNFCLWVVKGNETGFPVVGGPLMLKFGFMDQFFTGFRQSKILNIKNANPHF